MYIAPSLTSKTNYKRTKLELLDEIYQDIITDYVPTQEVTDALDLINELQNKLEQL